VVSYQRNDVSCDSADLVSGQLTENHVFIKKRDIIGTSYYFVYSCIDLTDCKSKVIELEAANFLNTGYSFNFDATYTENGYPGKFIMSGFNRNNMCVRGSVETLGLTVDDSTVTTTIEIKVENTLSSDYTPAIDGSCNTNLASIAAQNNACSSMKVYNATLVELL